MKPPRSVGARTTYAGPLPPTQLLLKTAGRIRGENVLVMGVPRDDAIAPAFADRQGSLVAFDYGSYLLHNALLSRNDAKLRAYFCANYERRDALHDVAVVYLQKGREFNDLVLSIVSCAVQPGAAVFVVGETKAGIRSSTGMLERHVGPVRFSDAARHCVIFEANMCAATPTHVDLRGWEREYAVAVKGRELAVVSLPGVFSHGRIDEGTAFLLNHLPNEIHGNVLDFGCGAGGIGAAIKMLHPQCEVTLVDVSALALEAAARTFERNSLSAAAIRPADVFAGVDACFDIIISNPPFHQGIGTDYEIVSSFFKGCARHLRPRGEVIIVANRFLPYESLMASCLESPKLVAENQKYKVLAAQKRA